MKPEELIQKTRDDRVSFPTVCACPVCGGARALFTRGQEIKDKELAYQVRLIQYGYYLAKREGQNWFEAPPKKCDCTCEHVIEEVRIGRCLHRWTCKKCGWSAEVDSSD